MKHIFISMALIAKIVWDSEKPCVISEKQMHPQHVTIWCGFWAEGIIGLYFFEKKAGQAATVNGAWYRDTITQFFPPKLNNIDDNICGFNRRYHVPCSQWNDSITARDISWSCTLSFRINQNWPPRSCDLTPLDFFLWGNSKWKIYVDNPTTTLQEEIKRCIDEIQPQSCRKVMKNFDEKVP